jgi:subtilisin family serine protease
VLPGLVAALLRAPAAAAPEPAAPVPAAVAAPALPPGVAVRLDPRLLSAALAADPAPAGVWVEFADKGEAGPADLARRLAAAAAALDPHARERRRRAGVHPLVDYLDLPVHAPYLEALRARGLAPYGVSRWFNRAAVRATGAQLAELAVLSGVAAVRPVERAERAGEPPAALPAAAGPAAAGVPGYGLTQAQVAQLGVPALHDSGYTGAGVRICVLDDGFNRHATHAALRAADVRAVRDFVRGTDDPTDTSATTGFRHGTETFGCIAGNLPGRYVGTAPGAEFLLARTEDGAGETRVEMVHWAAGAEWADSAGADIISSSVGYMTFDAPETSYVYADMDGRTTLVSRAAQIAAAKGILLVNSAGNEGNRPWHYIIAPADVHGDSLVAAAAVDAAGVVASFSSYGPSADGRVKPDLAALGVSAWVVSPSADTAYTRMSGTSFSCPLLAGLAACVMQARPAWPPRLVIRALRASASRAGDPDDRVGHGIPDGAAVLRWAPDTTAAPELPPLALGLRLVGPNPLTASVPVTRVAFGAGAGLGPPRLRVLDALGRRVVRELAAGRNPSAAADGLPLSATWDGRDDSGRRLPPGLYFVTLEAGGRRSSVRVASLR